MSLIPKFSSGEEIVYQIFPDRWMRTDSCIDPGELYLDNQKKIYGGTLKGIIRTIPYLKGMGVTALYLNPIFKASSSHRYDTVDYFKIDPYLGSEKDFVELAGTLHRNDMLLILDGVLNHTSVEHIWYKRLSERKKYYIMKDDKNTMMWKNGNSLPKLDTDKRFVRKALLKIFDKWKEADGWRLDASHLLPYDFLKEIKQKLKDKPIWIEDWSFSPQYGLYDLAAGVTNFMFHKNIITYFTEDSSPETFMHRVMSLIDSYPEKYLNASFNFLDNHDTKRLLSIVGRERTLRALVLLFTLPGTPLL